MWAPVVSSRSKTEPDGCVILRHVTWETYERLLADNEERCVPRMTYDQGALELVTPSMGQEIDTATVSLLVDIVAAELDIPIRCVGSTTFRREDLQQGFEANASFSIQHEERIRGQRGVDLRFDPPPDLVLEMEASRSEIDRLNLFASMGVLEAWRCDGQRITIFLLDQDGAYQSPSSRVQPVLTSDLLTRFLGANRTMLSPERFRMVSEWARASEAS